MPISAIGQPTTEEPEPEVQPPTDNNVTTIQDEEEVLSIEFEESCACFVIDKSPEEVATF